MTYRRDPSMNNYYQYSVVCNYGPAGNWVGEPVYL